MRKMALAVALVVAAHSAYADDIEEERRENQAIEILYADYRKCVSSEAIHMANAPASVEAITRAAVYRCNLQRMEHKMAVEGKYVSRRRGLSDAEEMVGWFEGLVEGMAASHVIEARMARQREE